jgi:hypothetical protein
VGAVIGSLGDYTLVSMNLALTLEQMCWPQDAERFAELRAEASSMLDHLEIADVEIPETQDGFIAELGTITGPITSELSRERGRILGDTLALPLFFLETFALRYAVHAGIGEPDESYTSIIEDCLDDVGVSRELSKVLEREAGWITLNQSDDGEPFIRHSDVIKAGSSFVLRVIEEWGRTETGLDGISAAIADLQHEVADFRQEFRDSSARLEQLIAEGNAETLGAIAEVKAALVEHGGIDAAEASALTDADPKGFWERVVRWFGSGKPRDAAEAALWTALDFVPLGSGVKLGIKVAEAVRKALK